MVAAVAVELAPARPSQSTPSEAPVSMVDVLPTAVAAATGQRPRPAGGGQRCHMFSTSAVSFHSNH